jgi:hypothetical protein
MPTNKQLLSHFVKGVLICCPMKWEKTDDNLPWQSGIGEPSTVRDGQ